MIKKLRIYQISLIAVSVLCIGLLAFMGITAIQKSLTLNLKFTAQPSKLIDIEYKLPSEGDSAYKTLFCNVAITDGNKVLTPSVTASASLSGDTLTLTDSFDTLGRTFDFRITNYNDYELTVTCAGVSKNTISDGNPIVFSNISTGGANVVFVFEEYTPPTITFDFNGGKIGDLTSAEKKGTTLPATLGNGYIPTKDGYTFAGYYSVDSTPEVIPDANKKCYSYDYLTNTAGTGNATIVSGINTAISDDTTLHARWLPFVIGNYVAGTGSQVPDQTVVSNGANVTYDAFAGYKYIQFVGVDSFTYTYGGNTTNETPLRFIIIGAGEGKGSALAGADISTITSYAFKDTVNGKPGNNRDLGANQVLLLSEQVVDRMWYGDNGLWTYTGTTIRTFLNGTFYTASGLNAYENYIDTPTLKTAWRYDSGTAYGEPKYEDGCVVDESSQIFVLASRSGGFSTGDSATNGSHVGVTSWNTVKFGYQNFCVEDYLGTSDAEFTFKVPEPKLFDGGCCTYGDAKLASFPGMYISYWWLRSGYGMESGSAHCVNNVGLVTADIVNDFNYGVRPAFVLNLA